MTGKLTHLLPCPFCGCTKVPKRQGNGIGDYWLECFECGASTRLREDGAGMEKDWNSRPAPTQQPNYCGIHCKKFCQNSVHGMCDGPPAQQQSVEVMEKKILELADKYRIDYGGDYSRNAKEHELDLIAFVRAVLPASTQQLSGLSEFLRNHANYIAAKSPEVVEHIKKLRAWADALDAMPKSIAQQPSGEVTDIELLNAMAPHLNDADGGYIVDYAAQSVVAAGRAAIAINAARTQGGES